MLNMFRIYIGTRPLHWCDKITRKFENLFKILMFGKKENEGRGSERLCK